MDSLQKIRSIFDKLVKNFNCILIAELLCVDEQIIPFKGRHRLKQYMSKKPKKWGYKAVLWNFTLKLLCTEVQTL